MKINEVVEFYIEGSDEMCRFFHYAAQHNIQWVNPIGDQDFIVAYVKPEYQNKLHEFNVYYKQLNTKFNEGDIVQFYRERNKPVGTIVKYNQVSKTFVVLLENGRRKSRVESHQLIHYEPERAIDSGGLGENKRVEG
jgi:hypothetical protein